MNHHLQLYRRTALLLCLSVLALAFSHVPTARAAGITVGGACTLVDAITAANTDTATGGCVAGSGADTITLSGTVTLTAVNNGPNGLPVITSVITIAGAGFTIARDAGAPTFRILEVAGAGDLTLNDLTISGGYTFANGGGIFSRGTLTVNTSTISGNTGGQCGGIFNFGGGTLTMTNSTVSGNTAFGGGGGLWNNTGSTLILRNSTISGNNGGPFAGDLFSVGTATLEQSVIAGNSAGVVGGKEIYAPGGTFTGTSVNLFGHSGESTAQAFTNFTPSNTDIIATSDGTLPTPLAAILGPLANNGGPSWTHALVPGSPAVDAVPSGPATDQRGVSRPQGPAFDLGAFEVEMLSPAEQIDQLTTDVQALVTSGTFSSSHGQALINKLDSAQTHLAKDNLDATIAKLQAFITQVQDFIANGELTVAEGQPLIDAAQAVIDAVRV